MQERQLNFGGAQFGWNQDAGDLASIDRGAFQFGLAQVYTSKVRLTKVAIAKIQPGGIEPSEIEAAEFAVIFGVFLTLNSLMHPSRSMRYMGHWRYGFLAVASVYYL